MSMSNSNPRPTRRCISLTYLALNPQKEKNTDAYISIAAQLKATPTPHTHRPHSLLLPPPFFFYEKVLLKLLKSREMKPGVEEANDGSLPAVGRIKLRCLSCDKAIPPDPQERPYMGSPRHEHFTQPPNQYDYEEHRYTYQVGAGI
jgi:hypothetical protein